MRASKAPEQWQQVLDAVNRDDYELANKLAVKYGFGSAVNKENSKNLLNKLDKLYNKLNNNDGPQTIDAEVRDVN